MATSALEAKINKIRQQNEEIRRRYEEVEEDKKNAAKLNALVQMTPSMDWPERKEPPEFCNTPRISHKQKPPKEHSDHPQQHQSANDTKKIHTFAQGEGPPPDPKYNFLADSEREVSNAEPARGNVGGRGHNKASRSNFKKKVVGREGQHKDHRSNHTHKDDFQPEYEAWRAERNRIDEDRISRQRTAEGNWRREWDNDKAHVVDEASKRDSRPTLGNYVKRDHREFDRRHHSDGNDYGNQSWTGNHRLHQSSSKNYHNYEYSFNNAYDQRGPTSPTFKTSSGSGDRTVIATDKSIRVTLNQNNATKAPVMSVKVNSPSIAGTGRVGPRQRTRVTYSKHSDSEVTHENPPFSRQKSFDEKNKNVNPNNIQKNLRKTHQQRKKENDPKSPYTNRKEFKREEYTQKSFSKLQDTSKRTAKPDIEANTTNNKESDNVPFENSASVECNEKDVNTQNTETGKDCSDTVEYLTTEKTDESTISVENSELIVAKDEKSEVMNTFDISAEHKRSESASNEERNEEVEATSSVNAGNTESEKNEHEHDIDKNDENNGMDDDSVEEVQSRKEINEVETNNSDNIAVNKDSIEEVPKENNEDAKSSLNDDCDNSEIPGEVDKSEKNVESEAALAEKSAHSSAIETSVIQANDTLNCNDETQLNEEIMNDVKNEEANIDNNDNKELMKATESEEVHNETSESDGNVSSCDTTKFQDHNTSVNVETQETAETEELKQCDDQSIVENVKPE